RDREPFRTILHSRADIERVRLIDCGTPVISASMANQLARISLVSLCAAAVISAIHHVLELGPRGAAIALIFIPAAYAALFWFQRGRARAALIVYALLNVWMLVG